MDATTNKQDQGTAATTDQAANGTKKVSTDYGKVCDSEDALKAVAKPERGEAYMVILFAGDAPRWCYADGYNHAYSRVAKERGGSCTKAGKVIPKDQLAASLATLSDDQLAAMGLSRKPQKGGKK